MLSSWIALPALAALLAPAWIHPFDHPQDRLDRGEVLMVVEIPHGSMTKYEIDKSSGHVVVDRVQSMPVTYPANYGAIPSTHADDGDHLDALVYTREPLPPGVLIRVRPIGLLPMLDGGEGDDKLIAVPVSSVDPSYDHIRELDDLAPIERERIRAFFEVYKRLPAGRKTVELMPMQDSAAAWKLLRAAARTYQERKTGTTALAEPQASED